MHHKRVIMFTAANSLAKAHPATQALSRAAVPEDLNEGDARRNPGEPNAEQARAGRYNKPRIEWRGLTLAIENPAGSVRRGRNRHGVTWEVRMRFDYGEILGTMGVDGDPVDVIVGPNLDAPTVYVVHQRKVNRWDEYDEDKCCVGFDSQADAEQAFLSNYNDPRFLGPITAMPVDEFVAKVRATRDAPAMIKAERHAPIQAPKGGAISPLNGEFYEGGQFMATQFDMPKSYKKKIKDIVRRTESKNIASVTAKRGMSGEFNVSKRMAGSDRSEIVFSGTEDQARHFMDELVSEKAKAAIRGGLQPHPTEVALIKSADPVILFFKAHVGPYLRGGKVVNLAGYQGRPARARAANGQLSLFAPPSVVMGPNRYKDKHPVRDTRDLFEDQPQHTEPTRELIEEHERLVDVLNSPSHEDDKAEAKKQAAELAGMKQEVGEHDHLLADIPGAKWRRGKGLIAGHYGVDVDGDVVGNYHAKPEDAAAAAKRWLADSAAASERKASTDAARAALRGRLEAGAEVTDADLNLLGLRPASSGLEWFIPAAAKLFGISSRAVRPHIKDLIRIGHTDMGVKKEFVDPKRGLQAIAEARREKPEPKPHHTETPEFKRWFGSSKVVDADGKPLRMYHGSYKDFAGFDRRASVGFRRGMETMDTVGSWFSSNPGEGGAAIYASGPGAAIYPVYLAISNPKHYDTFDDFLNDMHTAAGRDPSQQSPKGVGTTDELRNKLKAEGYDGIKFGRTNNMHLHDEADRLREKVKAAQFGKERDKAKAEYEAHIKKIRGMGEVSTEFDRQDVWVAFEPTQIKSATGNSGAFDPGHPDITKAQSAKTIFVRHP